MRDVENLIAGVQYHGEIGGFNLKWLLFDIAVALFKSRVWKLNTIPAPNPPRHLAVSLSTLLFLLIPLLPSWAEIVNHIVKAFPLNDLV